MQLTRDDEGYLVDPDEWNKDVAALLASEEKLELNDDYWAVIQFIRDYYADHLTAPDVRHVVKHMVSKNGYDKKEAKNRLFQLFPHGYVKQACKIAGMKRPRAWSTG